MKISEISENKGNLLFSIEKPDSWELSIGESIMIDGICSTVIFSEQRSAIGDKNGNFTVEYMPETINKTNIGERKAGDFVNLERSLRLNDLLSGHMVSGHVDTTGKVSNIIVQENSKVIDFTYKGDFDRFLVEKGSIAVNGISLTVFDISDQRSAIGDKVEGKFSVSLIPHTLDNTNLGELKTGDTVNLEFDLIAKYVNKAISDRR